jgi:hypothetical protein
MICGFWLFLVLLWVCGGFMVVGLQWFFFFWLILQVIVVFLIEIEFADFEF